jgi:uncharacterized protein (TIGR02145 family)
MRTKLFKIAQAATLGIALTFTISCSSDDGVDKGNDIRNYRTVQIGNQKWMAENLNYNVNGSKCYGEGGQVYDYDEETRTEIYTTLSNAEIQANCDTYGRLYDWATAKTVCPSSWHLPSDAEWQTLINYVETQKSCNDCAGKYLKSTNGWNWNDEEDISGNGADAFGFSALPGGRGDPDGDFSKAGDSSHWWSSSESGADYAYDIRISYDNALGDKSNRKKADLFSVRCVQD